MRACLPACLSLIWFGSFPPCYYRTTYSGKLKDEFINRPPKCWKNISWNFTSPKIAKYFDCSCDLIRWKWEQCNYLKCFYLPNNISPVLFWVVGNDTYNRPLAYSSLFQRLSAEEEEEEKQDCQLRQSQWDRTRISLFTSSLTGLNENIRTKVHIFISRRYLNPRRLFRKASFSPVLKNIEGKISVTLKPISSAIYEHTYVHALASSFIWLSMEHT